MTPENIAQLPQSAAATREAIIGGRKLFSEIAMALGCCERSVANVVDKMNVPYVRFLNRRYAKPEDVCAAFVAREVNRDPRGRGRPRKAA
jgi:hypothetical protein